MREDWIECSLIEGCDIHDNLRKPINSKERNERINGKTQDQLFPYYGATGQVGYIDDYLTDGDFVLIGEDAAPFLDYSKDVAYQISGKTWVNNHAHILKSKFNDMFLLHFLNNFNYKDYVSGTTRLKLTQGRLKQIPITIAPLPEQRAIVAKIEELFSDLDKGIDDLKKAQDQLKLYRQSVLSSTFPKKEFMELSKLVPSLSQGWSPKCINQNSSDETQWAVIKTSAIQAGKFVDFENKILPENLEPREQHEIKVGDILITRAGPRVRVGICCLVRNTRPRLINCDKVYRLILDRNQVDGEYFEYVMNSPEILSEIETMKSGTSDSGLNLTQKAFLKLRIPYVPLEQQRQIVRKIESRLSVCDKVEQSITESLEKAKALRQSILKKAFDGKLLSEEEIAECKAAKDYEPASILLKKIKEKKKK
tara:strand:- start:1759 stop:3027 length:1269 start_codon:yes stop_codon:yes gene_type:complete